MTYIPTEPPYTEEFLNDQDKKLLAGWDAAVEEVDNFFGNNESETGLETLDKAVNEYRERLKQELLEWVASSRQQYIVSCIDGYTKEELEAKGWKK